MGQGRVPRCGWMTVVTQIGILRGVAPEKDKSDLVTILGKNQPYIFIARVMFCQATTEFSIMICGSELDVQ